MRVGNRHGFTLVEILIVIGVIVILIALLLPAVGMVRARSRSSHCQSNQRQIGLALQSANKSLPFPLHSGQWAEKLIQYVDQEEGIFVCPDQPDSPTTASYGMTHRVHRMQSGDGRKIIAADYDTPEIVAVVGSVAGQNWVGYHAPRHSGRMNVLHYDGTVQSRDPDVIDPRVCRNFLDHWRPMRDFAIQLEDCVDALPDDATGTGGTNGSSDGTGDGDDGGGSGDGSTTDPPSPPPDPPNCDENIYCDDSDIPPGGENLVINGGAEQGVPDAQSEVDGWFEDTPELDHWVRFRYDNKSADTYVFDPDLPGSDRGAYFYFGSANAAESDMCQVVKACGIASQIDAGAVQYRLSAWIGIIASQLDRALVTLHFRDAGGNDIETVTIGPTTKAADFPGLGGFIYAFKYKSATGAVPVGTRTIKIVATCQRYQGAWCDGKAENLSLILDY